MTTITICDNIVTGSDGEGKLKRDWLRIYRENKNITQQEVAEKGDISQSTYAMIEIGERNPSVGTAKKIAEILEFDWIEFYDK